jgi:hypothetical protein
MAEETNQQDTGIGMPLDESLEVTLDKARNQLTLKDLKTGRVFTLKTNIIEDDKEEGGEEDEDNDEEPLSADQFRNALERLAALGLTWTADRIPRVVAKSPEAEDAFLSEEYRRLQADYPHLPRELSAVVFHALTGMPAHESVVGNTDELEKKIKAFRDLVLTADYRSEFFFKYATKVPYFEGIDWEIVLKTHERNVEGFPAVAYALLLLTFHNSNPTVSGLNEHQNVTVAVNLKLVNKLIRILVDIKSGLEDARRLGEKLTESTKLKGNDDAATQQ